MPLIQLHTNDNVLIAKQPLSLGEVVPAWGLRTKAQVPAGHKIASRAIAQGERVLKYNTEIGVATRDIAAGEHVHGHNLALADFYHEPAFGVDVKPVQVLPEAQQARFMGYVRPDGRVGTRNFIGLFSSVNCSATVIHKIAAHFTPERLKAYPRIDGVVAFAQTTGCGMASPSPHFDLLRRTIAGYVRHPNLAGALIVGLGCERNQVADLVASQALRPSVLMQTLVMQEAGGTRATIQAGIAAVERMLDAANAVTRTSVPASHLSIGLECGGSDGFSGITCNPALGAAMDILVKHGGTAILSETPEIHGVEHMLTRRAISPEVGQKLLDKLAWWTTYTQGTNVQFNGVVGHGNQQGGLANIFEKSLGSAMKAGSTPMQAVYEYAEPISHKGFVFMDSPGYDPVAVTGQIASGANLICFTTGRGSMFGSRPAPTIKLASNTEMFTRLEEDMDINCGLILDGKATVQEMGQRIFQDLLKHASGEPTKSELLGLGDHEFVPWHLGVVS
ncbi:MAG: altronate dehydratase [Limnohabitans sp.]|nr:altronate dehydratase [Limnohabitans sp.]